MLRALMSFSAAILLGCVLLGKAVENGWTGDAACGFGLAGAAIGAIFGWTAGELLEDSADEGPEL